jgi:hypothetical protein
MKKSISIILGALVILFSGCASNKSHYQVKKGRVTKENKCPDCINAW